MTEIDLERRVEASPQRVWEILVDHEGMPHWFPVREVVRRRPGAPDPNGVGALRVVRGGGLAVEERITEFEPPRLLAYELVAGAPVRDYRAEVALTPEGSGTRVLWSARFRPLVPGTGWPLRRALQARFRRALDGLAALAEDGRAQSGEPAR